MNWLSLGSNIAGIGSSVMQGIGSFGMGKAAKAAEQFNADLARAQAKAIRQAADLDIYRQRKAQKRMTSTQQARYGKAGVKLEGSPMEVMIDSMAEAELDIMVTDYNAKVGMAMKEAEAREHEKKGELLKLQYKQEGMKNLLSAGMQFGSLMGRFNTAPKTTTSSGLKQMGSSFASSYRS